MARSTVHPIPPGTCPRMPEEIGALSDALGNASTGIPQSEYGGALGLSAVTSLMQIPRYRQDQTPYLSIRGATFFSAVGDAVNGDIPLPLYCGLVQDGQ